MLTMLTYTHNDLTEAIEYVRLDEILVLRKSQDKQKTFIQ